MMNHEEVRQLVKKYFSEASEEQVETLMHELSREMEILVHIKIRELVGCERSKRIAKGSHP